MTPQTCSQIGIASWIIRAPTPTEMAARVNQLGLSKVQLELHLIDHALAVWGETQAVFRDHNIQIVSGMFGLIDGVASDEHWQVNRETVRRIGQIGQKLGVHLVSTHIGHIPQPQDADGHRKVVGRVTEIANVLHQCGMQLSFETGPEESNRLMQFLTALDQAGAAKIGINFDPANMLIYNTDDPTTALKNFLPRVVQCHLKDAARAQPGQPNGTETPLGEGAVDWAEFLSVLAHADYAGDLIIEREAGDNVIADVGTGIARLSALMNQEQRATP